MMDLISVVSEELAYYIYAEKKACLPGLGCFEAVYHAAVLDPSTNTLTAPSESIVFGIANEEGNHFVQYITEQLASLDVYEKFKQQIIDLLMSNEKANLPGLGLLHANQKGEISFEHIENDEFNLDYEDLILNPISTVEDPAENNASNAPHPGNEGSTKKNKEGMSFLRIAMLAVVSALGLVVFLDNDTKEMIPAEPMLVNNINISPKANQSEIYLALEGQTGLSEGLKDEEKADIVKRQDLMTAPQPVKTEVYEVEIITNTFGDRKNADRQIEMIESLGYQSAELEMGDRLISTIIVLSYSDEKDLASLLEKVKVDFPRAKVRD
jgi:hypothetical protein